MKKLPIGKSTFRDLIEDHFVYVDKTAIAYDLITQGGGYYFLSRPRRFGKSLFLDTLKTIFEGRKELFQGLYIYDRYDWSQTYPVIHLSFAAGIKISDQNSFSVEQFRLRIQEFFLKLEQTHNLKLTYPTLEGKFEEAIVKLYHKHNQKVVILIDEYDKPILDHIENVAVARQIRDELKSFYSVIKASDPYLKFVFITGVSKFSKVSLFSGLNNLNDITLNPNYATICGYTHDDLKTVFKEHLAGQDYEKIREWYNGYKWLGEPVYNPFDILLFISNNYIYRNYWFSTGTPTFLLKLIEKNRYYVPQLESVVKDEALLDSFDVDHIELETLLWQTGYLTIDQMIPTPRTPKYLLKFPNKEVQISLLTTIAHFMSHVEPVSYQDYLHDTLNMGNFDQLKTHLHSLFAAIPYTHFTGTKLYESEGYYASVLYAYLKSLGVPCIGEDVTNKGRIDLTLKMPQAIVILEFKLDPKTPQEPLEQIKARKYHEKYQGEQKPIYLVGISFSSQERNIQDLVWEQVYS